MEVDLTPFSYRCWLRAMRPQPLSWFLSLSLEDQEGLADLGDEYLQDFCIGIGYAVADPELAEAGMEAGQESEAEEVLVQRLAGGAAREIIAHASQEAAMPPQELPPNMSNLHMGGLGERRQEAAQMVQGAKDSGRVLMGRLPDPQTEIET